MGLLMSVGWRGTAARVQVVDGWVESSTGDGYLTIVNRTPGDVQETP